MIKAPRGTHDVLPGEQPLWRKIVHTAEAVCADYGYRPIVTPGFEETELFARTSGAGSDIVRKEMYTFTDRGGRSLTLRPEGTAPVARAYVEHGLSHEPAPFKAYMVLPMYRYDRPQKGRHREHWQFSAEALGSDDPAIDAEVIQLYAEFLRRLGVTGFWLDLNSIGDRRCRPRYIERLKAWLTENEGALDDDAREKRATSPLRVFDTKNEAVREALGAAPTIGESLCDECRAHFEELRHYLDAYGIEYRLRPSLVRGLDYYTRTTFEFHGEALGAQSQLVGGGRYDYLVEEIGGPPTPGIGFGAGIERLVLQLEQQGIELDTSHIEVFFACEPGTSRTEVLALMGELRRRGVACETDYAGRSLKGQLTQAQRLGADVTVIAARDGATIRRAGAADESVPLADIAERLGR